MQNARQVFEYVETQQPLLNDIAKWMLLEYGVDKAMEMLSTDTPNCIRLYNEASEKFLEKLRTPEGNAALASMVYHDLRATN